MKAIIKQKNKRFFEVIETFSYRVRKHLIFVPKGFITDLASTPKFLWLTFPPFGRYTDASIVHDYLYSKACEYVHIDRKESDLIFLALMEILGVPKWKRQLMYRGVRMFGGLFFRKE